MRRAILIEAGSSGKGRTLALSARKCAVGRSRTCTLVLSDKSVSRNQALIECRAGQYLLVDQNSRNGTRVNGVAVVRRFLRDGDKVAFGDIDFVFHESDEGEERLAGAGLDEDADGGTMASSSGATISAPVPACGADRHWEAVNAWQIVKSFGAASRKGLEETLKGICEDLRGLRGARRVVLWLKSVPSGGTGQKWIKAGAAASRAGVLFSEERLLGVAEKRSPVAMIAGRECRDMGKGPFDAVCVPVTAGENCRGSLYLEAEDILPAMAAEVCAAAADAIGMALSIWAAAAGARAAPRAPGVTGATIVGRSLPLQKAVRMAQRAAAVDSTVLIRGESGTGKELIARLIYEESARGSGPFVAVHCSSLEENLLGSALFGHEKGAFTGAVGAKRGLFEEADGGTIFFDEIGELSIGMQVKLLRVLQEGEFLKLGGTKPIRVDVRVLAATNRDLEKAVADGKFREDLYYRLKVIEVRLPPLRERRDDIPELVAHFIEHFRGEMETCAERISPEALKTLAEYGWPGNVRELRNVMERSLALSDCPALTVDDLPAEIVLAAKGRNGEQAATDERETGNLYSIQRRHILRMLRECGGNKKEAARRLGISRSTLYDRLRGEE